MKLTTLTILCAVAALLTLGKPLYGQPAEVQRVVRTFDFEERRLGNPETLPMHWAKVVGPGYPHYVNGQLATDVSRSGKYSFRLDLNGGSLAYRYDARRIGVMAGAHYRIETAVRTTHLQHARALLSAWFVDQDGHLLPRSVRHSMAYATPSTESGWGTLQVELSADDAQAAFLVLELGLLQPGQVAAGPLGQRALHVQDIRGTAWFDDLQISQVPRVVLNTDRPGNVFRRGEPVQLRVRVDDRFTDDLTAQIAVTDAEGKGVYQRSGTAEIGRAEQIGPGCKRLAIDLPAMPAGLYRASLTLGSQGQTLGSQTLSFIQLADANPPTTPDVRFGFSATSLPFAGWDDLTTILPLLSAGRVKLAVWGPQGDVLEVDPARFDGVLERLLAKGISLTACLADLPPDVAGKMRSGPLMPFAGPAPEKTVQGTSWPLILHGEARHWQPRLAFLISRHANHVTRWQFGIDGDEGPASDAQLRNAYDVVYQQFQRLVQKPDLAVPWPIWYELDEQAPASVSVAVPPLAILPSQVPLYINDAGNPQTARAQPLKSSQASVYLSWLPVERYGRVERIRDMAQRLVHALSAGADRIDLPLPLTMRQDQDLLVHEPTEDLLILRTVIGTLSGATFRGAVPIATGVEAMLFDRGGEGILAVWDQGAQGDQPRELSLNLGREPAMIDLWGNVTPVQKLGVDGRVSLRIGRTPIFLVGIDGQLMQTRASLSLDRPLIESSFQPHTRRLRFTNHFRTAVSGSLKLKPPTGWTVNPPTFTFSLNPGETYDREITLELPYNTVAGPKAIDARLDLQADRTATLDVPIMVYLGLSDVGMQTLAVRDGPDLLVQQMITNYGSRPIDYTAFAVYPGQSRQERLVTNLAPGKTTIKRYKFPSVEFKAGATVRAGVKEMVGTRVLNDEVAVQ